jgi:hypothetical protein
MIDYLVTKTGEIIEITDSNLFPLVDLINVLQTEPTEQPFWANVGIPLKETVISKVAPDYYLDQVKQYFRSMFDSLQITKLAANNYYIAVKLKNGLTLSGDLTRIFEGFKNA